MMLQYPDHKLVIQNYEERQSILLGYLQEKIENAAAEGHLIFDVEIDFIMSEIEFRQLQMYFKYHRIEVGCFIRNSSDNYSTMKFRFMIPTIE